MSVAICLPTYLFCFFRQLTQAPLPENKEQIKNILEEKANLEEKLKTFAAPQADSKQIKEKSPEPDAQEVKKRQEYLRAQRDKLVALKKEARKKQLDSETKGPARPKSARAAEKLLEGDAAGIDPQQLQLRKSLAERLKNKVVNKD